MTPPTEVPAAAGAPRPSPARLFLFGCVTTVFVVVGLAVVLEIVGRALLHGEFVPGLPMGRPVEATAVFDAEVGWRNRPDVSTRIIAPKFSYDVHISPKGLRDDDHSYEKPANTFRVLFLGDSMTWAWGVERELGFVHLAEKELGADVEAINLAVPGYSNDQHLWSLERDGVGYDPDIVVLCFILNDVVGNHAIRGHGIAHEKPRFVRGGDGQWVVENRPVPEPERSSLGISLGPYRWLYSNSAFLHLIFPEDLEDQLVDERREQIDAEDHVQAERIYGAEIQAMCDEVADADSVTYMLLDRVQKKCAEMGVPLYVFCLPHGHDRFLYSAEWYRPGPMKKAGVEEGVEFEGYLTRKLREAGERSGFRVFSVDQALLDTMTEHRVDLHVGDGHLNELGNRAVAERLVEELKPAVDAWRAGR